METARKEDDELTQAVGLSSSAAEREEARCRGAALVSSLQPGLAWIEERQAGPHGWVSYTRPCRSAGPARGCDALAASREGEMEQYQRGQRVPQLCLPVPSLETGRFFWMTPKPAALVRLVAQLMAPKPAALQPAVLPRPSQCLGCRPSLVLPLTYPLAPKPAALQLVALPSASPCPWI